MLTRSRKKRKINNPVKETTESDSESDYEEDEEEYDYDTEEDDPTYDPKDSDNEGELVNLGNLKKIDKIAYKSLQETKMEIIKTEPNIFKILKDPLLLNDRARLLQLYEIYKSTDPSTEQWLELRDKININLIEYRKKYQQHQQYTTKQHKEMKNQVRLLNTFNEHHEIEYKILQLDTDIQNKRVIYNKYKKLNSMTNRDEEYNKILQWLNWAISLPYNRVKKFSTRDGFTKKLEKISWEMDKQLYGMKTVKEQILLFASYKFHHPYSKEYSLGLIGPPGTGKTKLAKLLANVLDFPFEQISLGGITDPNVFKGHDETYVSAHPGLIAKCLQRMKYKNGIIFMDEFSDVSNNLDICTTLLHIADPTQNHEYKDTYLSGINIDLSCIWFVFSMNYFPKHEALVSRIFKVEVPGYDFKDKVKITKNYLFPKIFEDIKKPNNSVIINEEVASYIVDQVSDVGEKGVRSIEKAVGNIVHKLDFAINNQDSNGSLSKFNLSFDLASVLKKKKKLSYPVTLTKKMVDMLL